MAYKKKIILVGSHNAEACIDVIESEKFKILGLVDIKMNYLISTK